LAKYRLRTSTDIRRWKFHDKKSASSAEARNEVRRLVGCLAHARGKRRNVAAGIKIRAKREERRKKKSKTEEDPKNRKEAHWMKEERDPP